jgi:hypothetical protein
MLGVRSDPVARIGCPTPDGREPACDPRAPLFAPLSQPDLALEERAPGGVGTQCERSERPGHGAVPGEPCDRDIGMADLNEALGTFPSDHANVRGTPWCSGAKTFDENLFQAARRGKSFPRHLDPEVAGAGSSVSGRGR